MAAVLMSESCLSFHAALADSSGYESLSAARRRQTQGLRAAREGRVASDLGVAMGRTWPQTWSENESAELHSCLTNKVGVSPVREETQGLEPSSVLRPLKLRAGVDRIEVGRAAACVEAQPNAEPLD